MARTEPRLGTIRTTLPLFPTDDGWPYPDTAGAELVADAPDLDALELFGPHAYDSLTGAERAALRHRFGLDGATPLSMKQLAVMLGCTRTEARALVGSAVDKLRTELLRE